MLSFTLPSPGMVKLEVFDVNGRAVGATRRGRPDGGGGSTPALRWFPAGAHHILFDGSGLPSGIYLARLKAELSGSGTITPAGGRSALTTAVQKMVLLK